MKAVNSQDPGSNGAPAESNGTAARMARKRSLSKPPLPAPELASFAAVEVQEMDAPMLPAHPVVWLQPELGRGFPVRAVSTSSVTSTSLHPIFFRLTRPRPSFRKRWTRPPAR
jgi:hypothetical protein